MDDINLLEKIKELISQGFGRVVIARELGLPDGNRLKRLIKKVRETYPKLPPPAYGRRCFQLTAEGESIKDQIKDLIERGHDVDYISQTLGISQGQTSSIIAKLCGTEYKDEIDAGERINRVRELLGKGWDHHKIAKELGVSDHSASYWIERAKKKSNEANKLDIVRRMLDEGRYDTYDIAKRLKYSPTTASNTIKRIEGNYSPIAEWIKKASKNGVTLTTLQKQLGNISLEKAEEIIKENFPGCYVSKVRKGEDFLLCPIPDSSKEFESLQVDVEKKKELFTYYVSPMRNYMHVKFNDDLPGNEIRIWNFTDLHLGSVACRTGLLLECLEMVKDRPNWFIQLGGDLIENNSRNSAGHPEGQYLTPTEQVSYCLNTFAPYSYKTINYIEGNHEDRSQRFADINIADIVGEVLKIPVFHVGVVIEYEWRGIIKRQFHTHRYRNVFDDLAIKREVKKLLSNFNFSVQFFSSGHTHDAFISSIENSVLIPGRGFEGETIYIVNGGSFTQDTGQYSEKFPRSPKDLTYISFDDVGNHWPGSVEIKSL